MAVAQHHVSLSSLSHDFWDGRSALAALRDFSLSVPRGQFLSVIGPSGCGKSTLLRIIGGVPQPTAGEARVEGEAPAAAQTKREVGYVFQDPALLPWRTVLGNVRLPLEVGGPHPRPLSRARERGEQENGAPDPEELLERLGLGGFSKYYPQQLSGGMQQRVAIARALAFDPSLMLMDEPFGALDEITRESMRYELLRVWESRAPAATRKTVVFVTHSIAEAVAISDRVVVMSERPGTVHADIEIELPRPRTEEMERGRPFLDYVEQSADTSTEAGAVRQFVKPLAYIVPPLVALVALLIAWEMYVDWRDISIIVVPPPTEVAERFFEDPAYFWEQAWYTLYEATLGLLVGSALAIGLAVLMSHSRAAERTVMPLALSLKMTPLVAIGPVLVIAMGFGTAPKIAMAALLCFFPTLVNAITGFRDVNTGALDFMQSIDASRWQLFWKLRWPSALPYLFAALKVTYPLALTGAVVAEWFVGNRGLGMVIFRANSNLDTPTLFAAVAVLAVTGSVIYGLIAALERRLLFWHESVRNTQ